jgi:hypothetical protein
LAKQTKEAKQKIGAEEEKRHAEAPAEKEKTREKKNLAEKKKKLFFVGW